MAVSNPKTRQGLDRHPVSVGKRPLIPVIGSRVGIQFLEESLNPFGDEQAGHSDPVVSPDVGLEVPC
jgi:hypothetical protein